jgi:hypothetical protein
LEAELKIARKSGAHGVLFEEEKIDDRQSRDSVFHKSATSIANVDF